MSSMFEWRSLRRFGEQWQGVGGGYCFVRSHPSRQASIPAHLSVKSRLLKERAGQGNKSIGARSIGLLFPSKPNGMSDSHHAGGSPFLYLPCWTPTVFLAQERILTTVTRSRQKQSKHWPFNKSLFFFSSTVIELLMVSERNRERGWSKIHGREWLGSLHLPLPLAVMDKRYNNSSIPTGN